MAAMYEKKGGSLYTWSTGIREVNGRRGSRKHRGQWERIVSWVVGRTLAFAK